VSCNHVLTENNTKEVSNVVKNDYDGEMIAIKFGDDEFYCTADHLVPVDRDGKVVLCRAAELQVNDSIFVGE
jgi:hypothetical protein